MLTRATVSLAVLALAGGLAGWTAVRQEPASLTGERILRDVHSRYSGRRFTQVTFVQTTEFPNGTTQTWYEALAPIGRVRVAVAPLEARNGIIYRADSQYVLRNGEVAQRSGNQRWLSMLVLLDLYALPIDRVLSRATELGLDLAVAHRTQWNGRPVVVAGAQAGDTLRPQVWYDAEHLYPVRLMQRAGPTALSEWHLSDHKFLSGGWIEGEIRIFGNGKLTIRERYDSIVPRRNLPDSLFEPEPYRQPEWVVGKR